jgi:hypothetical protein
LRGELSGRNVHLTFLSEREYMRALQALKIGAALFALQGHIATASWARSKQQQRNLRLS